MKHLCNATLECESHSKVAAAHNTKQKTTTTTLKGTEITLQTTTLLLTFRSLHWLVLWLRPLVSVVVERITHYFRDS